MDREQINAMLENGTITEEQHAQLIATLDENERLKAKAIAGNALRFKVTVPREPGTNNPDDKGSEGGAVSVYGMGRFPTTLYKEQWIRLLSHGHELVAFMKENDALLSVKVKKAA